MNVDEAKEITGGLSTTSKMPCKSYGIPSAMCFTGTRLKKVKGSTCEHCYTYRYARYAHVLTKQIERVRSITNPRWVEAMVVLLKAENNPFFRWHDSGDIQDVKHLEDIVEVTRQTPEIMHWLPTLETRILYKYANLHGTFEQYPNLVIRVSTAMINAKANVGIAQSLGVLSSNVVKEKNLAKQTLKVLDQRNICPAKTEKHGGKCLDCRRCWDKEQVVVGYIYH